MGTCDLDDVGNPAIDQDPIRGGGGRRNTPCRYMHATETGI